MKRLNTQAIVLSRTDYGEADRILTLLTPDQGKVKAIAKGVRKSKSKLAGGIELFSVSEISYIVGRSEINTLVSTRLIRHYGDIVKDLDRTSLAYELLKKINQITEEQPEQGYFTVLDESLRAVNDHQVSAGLVKTWFLAQLLRLGGHTPNLRTQKNGQSLTPEQSYDFDFEATAFKDGQTFGVSDIKFLRLIFSDNKPEVLQKISGINNLLKRGQPLVERLSLIHQA